MRTYEKIPAVFERATDGSKKMIEGQWCNETVKYLKDLQWSWTEKVDGTNIQVCWDGYRVTYGGRTEDASIPASLVNRLNELFCTREAEQLFEQTFGDHPALMYGEGFGKGIQDAGKRYNPDSVDFILFDLLISGNYQPRGSVDRCARTFCIQSVPVVGFGTLEEAVEFVKSKPKSALGDLPMEGLVCRPAIELRDRCDNRVIVKIKVKDFSKG